MRLQRKLMLGALGALALLVLGAGAFFGARAQSGGGQASANSGPGVAAGDEAHVAASAGATGVDPFVNQYAGEFLCGDASLLTFPGFTPPLGPGFYNTEISIHNANSVPALIQKKAVPMPLVTPEQIGLPTQRLYFQIPPDAAFQTDCTDIMNQFFPAASPLTCNGFPVPQPPNAFCKGYLVVEGGKQLASGFIVPAPLDMTIAITVTGPGPGGLTVTSSLDFELQPGRPIQYLPTLPCPSGWSIVPPCP